MPNQIHINTWLEKSKEDFYLLFVQAWIPFNAWYNKEIAPNTKRGSDRECINYIAQNRNDYKNKVVAFLSGSDRDSLRFQQEMVDLHKALLLHTIPDQDTPINFKTTTIYDTSNPVKESDFYTIHYKIERIPNGSAFQYDVKIMDKNTGRIKYNNRFNNCKVENLDGDPNFQYFTEAIKKRIKEQMDLVNITAPTNVIMTPIRQADGSFKRPPHSIIFGKEDQDYFIDDIDKIAQVLIQLIYSLRCEIFHGSLNPTESNMVVYEHAYHLQSMLIKELR